MSDRGRTGPLSGLERASGAGRLLITMVRTAFRLARQADRRTTGLIAGLNVVSTALLVLRLLLLREAVQRFVSDGGSADSLLPVLLALLLLSLLGQAVRVVLGEQQSRLGLLLTRLTDQRILARLRRTELIAFESPRFLDLLARVRAEGSFRPQQLTQGVAGLAAATLAAVALLVTAAALAPALVVQLLPLIALGYVPVLVAQRRNGAAVYLADRRRTELDRRVSYLFEVLTERAFAAEVRAFGMSPRLEHDYDAASAARLAAVDEVRRHQVRRILVSLLSTAVVGVVVLLLLLRSVQSGQVTVAAAAITGIALLELGSRLGTVFTSVAAIYESSLYMRDVESFLGGEVEPRRFDLEAAPQQLQALVVDGVRFRYPESTSDVLLDVSFSAQVGEVLAVVGANGSGKSSLVKVLAGLYEPAGGSVSWLAPDGSAVSVAGTVSVLLQDYGRYDASLHDNITLGSLPPVHPDRYSDAVLTTGVDELAARLPDGERSLLGRRFTGGHELSTGQWQRVALARALSRDAAALVLDEPTAALDPLAERHLLSALRDDAPGRIVFVVTHRAATAAFADRVLVMEAGRLVADGTHADLTERLPSYAALFRPA